MKRLKLTKENTAYCWTYGCIPVTPTLERQRQEATNLRSAWLHSNFKASLEFRAGLHLKKSNPETKETKQIKNNLSSNSVVSV